MLPNLLTFLKAVTGLGARMNLDNMFPVWTVTADVPYIIITLVSSPKETDKANTTARIAASYQVDIYAGSFSDAYDIAALIKAYAEGYGTLNGCSFYIDDERDLGEEDAKKFRRSLDIAVEKQSL